MNPETIKDKLELFRIEVVSAIVAKAREAKGEIIEFNKTQPPGFPACTFWFGWTESIIDEGITALRWREESQDISVSITKDGEGIRAGILDQNLIAQITTDQLVELYNLCCRVIENSKREE